MKQLDYRCLLFVYSRSVPVALQGERAGHAAQTLSDSQMQPAVRPVDGGPTLGILSGKPS